MAKTINKTIHKTKLKTSSIFLCCFCPPPPNDKDSVESLITATTDPIIVQKQNKRRTNNWFSWVRRIRIRKNSTASKTVPLEEAHYSKVKSKSTLHHKSLPLTTQALPPVHPATPYYTPSQTRHDPSNNTHATRSQQGRGTPKTQEKRQQQRVSSLSMQHQTTSSRKQKNTRRSSNDAAVAGMSIIVVTLVILIFWGRICAILCTSVWLYCIPRFRNNGAENDEITDSLSKKKKNEVVDMDSEEYKKRVIMEGLLERNHKKG